MALTNNKQAQRTTNTMHTLKLQNIDRNGKFIKGHTFVSGTILEWTPTHFTLEVEHHDDWHGTSHVRTHRIDRKRIRFSNKPLPWAPYVGPSPIPTTTDSGAGNNPTNHKVSN